MRVVVVGGGVVGLSVAYFLQKGGAEPVVAEAGRVGGGCSLGNGGWVCPSLAVPVAGPHLTWRSLWRARRVGESLFVKHLAPGIWRWLVSMRRHCGLVAYDRGVRALAALALGANDRYEELASDGVAFERHRRGILFVFREAEDARQQKMDAVSRAGVGARAVACDELCDMEPLLRPGFGAGGLLVESEGHVRPETVTKGLADALRARGARVREHAAAEGFATERIAASGCRRVRAVVVRRRQAGSRTSGAQFLAPPPPGANGPVARPRTPPGGSRNETSGRRSGTRRRSGSGTPSAAPRNGVVSVDADAVVLAAGAQTGRLARRLGAWLPTTAGKGCSLTVDKPREQLRRPVYLAGAMIGGSPYRDSLRFFGGMEFSGINRRLDQRRVQALRQAVDASMDVPGLGSAHAWTGMRPMLPDTLPAIGRLPGYENAYVAAGHQMLGMTLAPATGAALARLVLGREPGLDLRPFLPGRFA